LPRIISFRGKNRAFVFSDIGIKEGHGDLKKANDPLVLRKADTLAS
jgi:hypothetical protein